CRAARFTDRGRSLAQRGNVNGAVASLRKARELFPIGSLDPDVEARRLAAEGLVARGLALPGSDQARNTRGAVAALKRAEMLDPSLRLSPVIWNDVCWCGALRGHAAEVLSTCERAVSLDSANWHFRDSRGVARARTGNVVGAIEDFRAFI